MRTSSLRLVALAASFVVVGAACSHKKTLDESSNKVSKGAISLSAAWVKDKKKNFDIQFKIRNDSDQPIIIKLGDMQCYKGETQGELKHTFFNTGERTIDLRGGQFKSFRFVCRFDTDASGDPRVIVKRVYDNPSGDGATLGKVILENVEWALSKSGK